jgi:hypothetical protein
MPITPALRRLRQEDLKFEDSLDYIDSDSKKRGGACCSQSQSIKIKRTVQKE